MTRSKEEIRGRAHTRAGEHEVSAAAAAEALQLGGTQTISATDLGGISEATKAKFRTAIRVKQLKDGDPLTRHDGRNNGLWLPTSQGPIKARLYEVDLTRPNNQGRFLGTAEDLTESNSQSWFSGIAGIEAEPSVVVVADEDQELGYLPPLVEMGEIPAEDIATLLTNRIRAFARLLTKQDRIELGRQIAHEVPQVVSSGFSTFNRLKDAGTVIPLEARKAYNATSGAYHNFPDYFPPRLIMIRGFGRVVLTEEIVRKNPAEGRLLAKGIIGEIGGGEMIRGTTPIAQLGTEHEPDASFFFHYTGLTGKEPEAVFLPLSDSCAALEIPVKDDDILSRWFLLQDIARKTTDMTIHNAKEDELEEAPTGKASFGRWIRQLVGRRSA